MGELKRRKYLGILGILLLVVGIIFLFSYGKIDKYRGLIKVKNVEVNKKILSSVANTEAMTSNGTDEIDYEIKYTLDRIDGIETRNAVIEASLNSEYAEFKDINGNNIESTVSNEGKKIEVRINNVRLGDEQRLNLVIIVRNAPNNEEISPVIRIKEATGDYTEVTGEPVKVSTNSVTGIVYDENNLPVGNIELSINKNGNEIKRTYTTEDGRYVFSDLENGEYLIKVEEDIYDIVSGGSTSGSEELHEIKVRNVDKFDIETHKYIENLRLTVDGKKYNYTYKDKEKVVETLKNAKRVSGEIEYRVVVKNNSEKDTVIERVIDERGEGLEFNKDINAGWEEVDDVLYYRPLEGVSISSKDNREVKLVLHIKETTEIKTYINKLTSKGEIKEKVVYILDGRKVKEESVIEGDKISRPNIGVEADGWYTDKNFTNKYNFNREVNKDLILYAKTNVIRHRVRFIDKDPDTLQEDLVEEVIVKDREKVSEKDGPTKTGYTFVCWRNEYGICYNFNDRVERDITLTSSYDPIVYTIEYSGITNEERTTLDNPTTYTVRSNITLNNPSTRKDEHGFDREVFLGWKEENESTPDLLVKLPQLNKLGNKKYTAIFQTIEDDEYPIRYILNGGTVSGNPNVYKKTDTFTLNNPTKEGYNFTGWTGSNGNTPNTNVTIQIGTEGELTFEAHYTPINYNITYELNGGTVSPENPTTYNIETPSFTLNNPTKEGYNFTGWTGTDITGSSTSVTVPQGSMGDRSYTANYTKKKYTVTYMDGDTLHGIEEVEYNAKALGNVDDPVKAHNIFLGWTLNNTLYDFDTPVTNNITLYSSYELVEPPVITHTPTEWTRNNVVVNITTDHDDYSYKYRVADGSYQNYAGPFVIEENTDIYGYSVKSNVISEEVKHEIRNIDKINPTINSFTNTELSPVSATVKVKAIDNESGMNKFMIYLDDTLVFDSDSYTTDLNSEKELEYVLTNLEQLTQYEVKVEAEDKVGNVSEEVITIETPAKHYVARTLEDDGTEIKKYETLREAIESPECVSRCNIQMLDNVTETNAILDGQIIKLDLNGLVITGLQDKAFDNNGVFQVVDYNDEAVGKIVSENIGIDNAGTLTVGENEVELNVSKIEPIVQGSIYGVYNRGTFKFFDGRIIGDVAIKGEVTETPYSYNTSVNDDASLNKQVATLEIIADAEARINTTYYTKLQGGVDDSKNGTYEDVDYTRPLISQLRTPGDFGFIYNDKTGHIVNTNQGVESSLSHSYIKLDLTNYDEDQILTVNTQISSQSGADIGYVTVTEDTETPEYSDGTGRFIYVSGTQAAKDYTKMLEKGKVYYLHVGYRKDGSTNSGLDTFTINSINLGKFVTTPLSDLSNARILTDSSYYFEKQPDGSLKNTNHDRNTQADSYFVVDMTNIDEEKYIIVEATLNSRECAGYITVTDSPAVPAYNQTAGRQVYLTNYTARNSYVIKLIPNQVNYVHMDYYKNAYYSENFDFIIHTIKAAKNDISVDSDGVMQQNGDYYFVQNDDGSYESNNKYAGNTTAHSYMSFDLTDYAENQYIYINATIGSERNCDIGYITVTDSTTAPAFNEEQGRYVYASDSYTSDYRIPLTAGRVNYVHFGYRKDGSGNAYSDSFKINSISYYTNTTDPLPAYIIGDLVTENTDTFNVPKLNENVDTVEMLRNITLTEPMEVVETRDVVLDLNGYTLTTSNNDYVIKNDGNLTIIDKKYGSDNASSDQRYAKDLVDFDNEYDEKTAAKSAHEEASIAEYISTIPARQVQYNSEYNTALESAIENSEEVIDSDYVTTDDYFDFSKFVNNSISQSGGSASTSANATDKTLSFNVWNGVYGSIYYDKPIELSSGHFRITGNCTTDHNYTRVETGALYIGFATTPNATLDDFIEYGVYNVNRYTTNYNFDITIDTPGTYYFKAILNNTYGWTNYATISSMNVEYKESTPYANISTSDPVNHDISNLFDKVKTAESSYSFSTNSGSITSKMIEEGTLTGYKVYLGNDTTKYPSQIILEGSLDGITYTPLDTTSVDGTSSTVEVNLTEFDSYNYYRWNFSGTGDEIELLEIESTFYKVARERIYATDISNNGYVQDHLKVQLNANDPGNTDGVWQDLSGNDNDFTITNGTFDHGALKFLGNNSGAESVSDISITENSTFEITVKANNNNAYVIDVRTGSDPVTGVTPFAINSSNKGNSWSSASNVYTYYDSDDNFNTTHTYSFVYTGSGLKIYKDGSLYSSGFLKGLDNTSKIYLGKGFLDSNFLNGSIYTFRYYDKALTETEIKKNAEIDKFKVEQYEKITNQDDIYSINDYIKEQLILYYDGVQKGTTDGVWKDLSGNNYDGNITDLNSIEGGYKFNGTSSSVSRSTYSDNIISETVEVLFSSKTNKNQLLYMGSNKENISIGLWGSYIIVSSNSSHNVTFNMPNDIYDGNIKLLQVTYKDGEYEAYYNGELLEKSTSTNQFDGSNENIYIGARASGNNFDGNIYAVRVYKKRLKPDEITRNYNVDSIRYNFGEIKKRTATRDEVALTGNIISTTNSVVRNNQGAYLEVKDAFLNLNKSGSLDVITNYGTLFVNENAHINAMQSSNRGINNEVTGELLPNKGEINLLSSNNIGLLNHSYLEDQIEDFVVNNVSTSSDSYYNNSLIPVTYKNITSKGSGIDFLHNSIYATEIENSSLESTGNESYIAYSSSSTEPVHINDSILKNRVFVASFDYNSSYASSRPVFIDNCTLTGSRQNIYNFGGTFHINDSTLTNSIWNVVNTSGGIGTIEDSVINGPTSTISNGGTLSIKDTEINVNMAGSPTHAIENRGTLSFDGGSMDSSTKSDWQLATAIYNAQNATLNIKNNFKIKDNFPIGIYNRSGHIVLGDSSTETASVNYPLIQGTYIGIFNNREYDGLNGGFQAVGTFKMYDGKIIGYNENNSLEGPINEVKTNYDINIEESGTTEILTLRPLETGITENDYVARIGSTKYTSVQKAIDAVSTSDPTEIVLLKDFGTDYTITVPEGKNITINYDNHFIRHYGDTGFINNGTLTLKDETSDLDKVSISYGSKYIVNNKDLIYDGILSKNYDIRTRNKQQMMVVNNENATFTMNSGKLTSVLDLLIENHGLFTMNGGTLIRPRNGVYNLSINPGSTVSWVPNSYFIENTETGEVVINNGTLNDSESSGTTIYNLNKVTINDGTLNLSGRCDNRSCYVTTLVNNSSADSVAKLLGGTYTGRNHLVTNAGYAEIKNITSNSNGFATNNNEMVIEGVDFSNLSLSNLSSSGTLTIKDSTLVSSGTTLNISGGTANIDNLTCDSTIGGWYSIPHAVAISGSSVVDIKNSTFTKSGAGESNTFNITGSSSVTFTNTDVSNTTGNNSYRAINTTSSGEVVINSGNYVASTTAIGISGSGTTTLGSKDGTPTKTTPVISGSTTGLYNASETAVFNFYDGIIKGNEAIHGSVTDIEDGYEIILETETETGKEVKYLGKYPVIQNKTKIDALVDPTDEQINQYKYLTIQDGIDNSDEGDTLQIIRDVSIIATGTTTEVPSNKNVVIDLNGHRITSNINLFMRNNGTLRITDSTEDKEGTIVTNINSILENNGTFILDQGTFTINTTDKTLITNNGSMLINDGKIIASRATLIDNYGDLTIQDGELQVTTYYEDYSTTIFGKIIINNVGAETEINGGYFYLAGVNPVVYNYEDLTITGGTFKLDRHYNNFGNYIDNSKVVNNYSGATATITGGTYERTGEEASRQYGTFINNDGTAYISNVTSSYNTFGTNTGTMTITNSTFNNLNRTGLSSSGTLTVTGGTYSSGYNSNTIFELSGSGTSTFGGITVTAGTAISSSGDQVVTIDDSTINTGTTGIAVGGNSKLTYTNTNISTSGTAINVSTTNTVDVISGTVKSTSGIGLYKEATGTITIGEQGGTPSKTNPKIEGVTSGIQVTNSTGIVNFYDGVFKGTTPIDGIINEIETGYEIIYEEQDGIKTKYLDNFPIIENIDTGDTYSSIQTAINNASNNDTLKVLRELTSLPDYATIEVPAGKTITIDMNGKTLYFSNDKVLTNNGTLTITDSTKSTDDSNYVDASNKIYCYTGSTVIENNGTLTIGILNIHTRSATKIIDNAGTLTFNSGTLTSGVESIYINNTDTVTINDGKFNGTAANTPVGMFVNNASSTMTVNYGRFNKTARAAALFNNYGSLTVIDGIFTIGGHGNTTWEQRNYTTVFTNQQGATIDVSGGTYNSNNDSTKFIYNAGTADVSNIISSYSYFVENVSTGVLTLDNITSNMRHGSYSSNDIRAKLYNTGSMTIKNSTISSDYDDVINISGTGYLEIINSSITGLNQAGGGHVLSINGSSNIKFENPDIVLTNNNPHGNTIYVNSSSEIVIKDGTYNGTASSAISVESGKTVTIEGGSYTGTTGITGSGNINVKGGTVNGSTDAGISYSATGTVNIGEPGGIPSTTEPSINGETYGLIVNNVNSNVNFYDGIITGKSGAIYGYMDDTEPGYKIAKDVEEIDSITYEHATLTVVGETERIAVVNNINFMSLQSAINYAVRSNTPNIILYKNITLEADLIKPDGIEVNVYLNNKTITEGDYTIDPGIHVISGTPQGVGGAIHRFLASITGTEINPKDIVIFEMSDGSRLESTVTYKLYKLTDNGYKIVKVNENLIGNYDLGSEKEEMNVTRGKLYIYGIGEGTYKLVGTDTKEITFEINAHDVSNNIRINNTVKANRTVSVIATVILQLQTGVARSPYILVIMVLIIVILGFIAYKKHKESYEE